MERSIRLIRLKFFFDEKRNSMDRISYNFFIILSIRLLNGFISIAANETYF
jgi:hypothetical protein